MSRDRNISAAKRREWLEQHDDGVTVASIAVREQRDPRTVKAQIERAAQEQEIRLARRGQIRGALDKHNEDLLNVVRGLSSSFQALPDEQFTPIAAFPMSNRTTPSIPGCVIVRNELVVRTDPNFSFPKRERLLKEHLKDERTLWRDASRWKNSYREYIEECLHLGEVAAIRFEDVTGLKPVEEGGSDTGFNESMVSQACRLAIEGSSPPSNRAVRPGLQISGDQLRYGGATLARSETESQLKLTAKTFEEFLDEMWDSPETRKIARREKDLDESGASIRDRLEDILLFEYISGKCNVCGKYSI